MFENSRFLIYGEKPLKGTGIWCYLQAFEELGIVHEHFCCEMGLSKYQNSYFFRIIRKLNGGRLLEVDRLFHLSLLEKCISKYNPEVLIIFKGLFIDHISLLRIKKRVPIVVLVNHDDFFSLNKNNVSICQKSAIPYYDHIFVTRLINLEEIKKYNINVSFFPFSYLPSFHKIYDLTEEDLVKYRSDVLFVGTYEYDRAKLLEFLVNQYDLNLVVYGSGWQKLSRNSVLRSYVAGVGLWGEEMAKAIQLSKICIGFLRKENRDQYTQRTFEILACGGFLLAEKTDFHLELFENNQICSLFDPENPYDFLKQVQRLLDDDQLRENMRRNGIDWIRKSDFTYESRVVQLLETLKYLKST
jgi:spore maturation protein CgeB